MTTPQSLLPSDDEGPVSLLSSAHYDASIMEPDDGGDDTPLSRLISNSNNEVSQQNYWNVVFSAAKQPSISRRDPTTQTYHYVRPRGKARPDMLKQWNRHRSHFIVRSGACLVLFGICVWSSYTANTWYDTALFVEVSKSSWLFWNSSYGMLTRTESNNLLDFLQKLDRIHHDTPIMISFLVIIATTVVLPCVTMVFLPIRMVSLISTNQSSTILHHKNRHFQCFASIYEIIIRFSFLIIHVVVWIIISNHFLSFHPSNGSSTNISFDSVVSDGLVYYTFGVSLAIACAVMIRSFYSISSQMYQGNIDNPSLPPDPSQSENPAESVMYSDTTDNTAPPLMQILEEQTEATPTLPVFNVPKQRHLGNSNDTRQGAAHALPFWKVLFVFQCGLLSIILIVPAFYLPVIQFQYDDNGWISDMMSNNFQSISLYQIPAILYSIMTKFHSHDSHRISEMMLRNFHVRTSIKIIAILHFIVTIFQRDDYDRILDMTLHNFQSMPVSMFQIPVILFSDANIGAFQMFGIMVFLLFTTVLCPLYAIFMAVAAWIRSPSLIDDRDSRHRGVWNFRTRRQCRDNLYMVHPAVGSIVVSVSLLLSENIVKHWNVYDMTNLICPDLGTLGENHCSVDVSSSFRVGTWCYIVHSMLLEMFIFATLKWS